MNGQTIWFAGRWERIKNLLPGRAGIPWRDLPERFGDWKNIHRRHSRWSQSGVWENVFGCLSKEADNEYAMIDATCDALGNPTGFHLTPGQACDLEPKKINPAVRFDPPLNRLPSSGTTSDLV